MKFVANPVEVEAFRIEKVTRLEGVTQGGFLCFLENGKEVFATPEMASRMTPAPGDYWVIQSDGYVYLNPKEVFLRKYKLDLVSLVDALKECVENLEWCSASQDFLPEGTAREGWMKGPEVAIKAGRGVLDTYWKQQELIYGL